MNDNVDVMLHLQCANELMSSGLSYLFIAINNAPYADDSVKQLLIRIGNDIDLNLTKLTETINNLQ